MPGPIEATGAVRNPTKYGALTMGARQYTGLWTQRVPYRDAAVEYLVSKFYSGSRFDSMIDGLNREITQRMSVRRRPGNSYATGYSSFSPGLSFYAYKSIQAGVEVIRTLYDQAGTILDITGSLGTNAAPTTLFTKAASGPARFLGINTTMFFTAGQQNQKWLYPGPWQASTSVQPGTLINNGAGAGTVYMALGGMSLPIAATACIGSGAGTRIVIYITPANVPENFANLLGANVTFSGLTGATFLNGLTKTVVAITSSTLGVFEIAGVSHANYAQTADAGTASTGSGTTGTTLPSFTATEFNVTQDGGQQWKSYGTAVQDWQIAAPTNAPTITALNGTRFWQPQTVLGSYFAILDQNGNIQIASATGAPGTYTTGRSYPNFAPYSLTAAGNRPTTVDGSVIWTNWGPEQAWMASANAIDFPVILDSNQNIQILTGGLSGNTGSTQPTWATTLGATTSDGAYTWQCWGPGVPISYETIQYAFSYHGVDGSVSEASPATYVQGGILGLPESAGLPYLTLTAPANPAGGDTQIDQIWIGRTAQGEPTIVLEDQIPVDAVTVGFPPVLLTAFSYGELGVPDTSTNGGGALDALVPLPVADAGNPPQAGMTAPAFHLERAWAIVDNTVVYSGGPDTVTGSGFTAWPPANVIPFPCQPIKLIPVTVQNGGLLVMTTDGTWIILGTGTSTNPFYATVYFSTVSVSGYNAIDVYNNSVWLMESNGKVSNLAIEYPFNPQTGYNEVGFPIGDQFVNVTTGGNPPGALYNPATAGLTWCVSSSADTAMYVSDGRWGWFRMSFVNQPESGLVWSPRAVVAGGATAVQAVETSTGKYQLLMGPVSSGTILARDQTGTVWTDWAENMAFDYDAYDTKGVILLCSTGQWAEVQHISAKSAAVGARPTVSVLMNEIAASAARPYTVLGLPQKSNDPAEASRSVSVYSDRYELMQNGMELLGDCILVRFDYGSQAYGDELLDWGIYAGINDEPQEEVAK